MPRTLRRYFLLLGIPLVFVTIGGLRLLFVETVRAREAETSVLQTKTESIAHDLSRVAADRGDVLLARIAVLDSDRELRDFAVDEPLVNGVFRWRDGQGVVWTSAKGNEQENEDFHQWMRFALGPSVEWRPTREGHTAGDVPSFGWQIVPGRTRPMLMGWVRVSNHEIRGVSLRRTEVVNMLERYLDVAGMGDDDNAMPQAMLVEVFDESGQRIISATRVANCGRLYGRCSLAPMMPDWTVHVHWRDGDRVLAGDSLTVICIGVCLLVLLVGSLLVGISMIVRDSRHARQEALQKTTFVNDISHDLKTPLTTICLCADLLSDGRLQDEERRRKAARTIAFAASRLSGIVSTVLEFGRLESGRWIFSPENVSLDAFLHEVEGMVPEFTCRLQYEDGTGPEDWIVWADRMALQGILFNLFENVVKYAAAGGPADLIVYHVGDRVRLQVMDRGPGMTKEEMEHAFDRFWRGDNSMARGTGGSGLGLSIAHRLATGMYGDLTVSHREGGGCIFTLELPTKPVGTEENHG